MKNYNAVLLLLVGLLLLAGCRTASTQDQLARPAITVLGEWKEHWGTPGQTDVTYHDRYRVTQTRDGNVKVQILSRNQRIYDEKLDGTLLTFTQRTDAFVVKYSLTLQQDGSWMVGTATTPQKVVKVKWERTK